MLKDPELAAAYDDTRSMLEATTALSFEDSRTRRLCATLCLMLRVLDKLAEDTKSLRIGLIGHYHDNPKNPARPPRA